MTPTPEFQRLVVVEELPEEGISLDLNPTADEISAVARRLELVQLREFNGSLGIKPAIGREIAVEGTIRAVVEQNCVVTGDPVTTHLSFPLERRYAEGADVFAGTTDTDDDLSSDPDDDAPDPVDNGKIDVGEAAVEELALQIPLYPRADGAVFDDVSSGPGDDTSEESPFAALADLKNKMKSND